MRRALIVALAGAALLSAAPAHGRASPSKTVKIGDNYYTPKTADGRSAARRSPGAGPASTRPATSTTSSSSPAPRA